LIADIGLAPRNADGNVEYSFDFYILKPIDLTRGAHKVMYEPPNRGGKTWANFGRYRSLSEFYKRVTTAIDDLVKGRLMLCEDAVTERARLLKAGMDAGLSSPDGKLLTTPTLILLLVCDFDLANVRRKANVRTNEFRNRAKNLEDLGIFPTAAVAPARNVFCPGLLYPQAWARRAAAAGGMSWRL